jgi:hypothetical protein
LYKKEKMLTPTNVLEAATIFAALIPGNPCRGSGQILIAMPALVEHKVGDGAVKAGARSEAASR